jgi:hypothetical protein
LTKSRKENNRHHQHLIITAEGIRLVRPIWSNSWGNIGSGGKHQNQPRSSDQSDNAFSDLWLEYRSEVERRERDNIRSNGDHLFESFKRESNCDWSPSRDHSSLRLGFVIPLKSEPNLNRITRFMCGLPAMPFVVSPAECRKERTILITSAFHGISRCQASWVRVAFSRSQITLVLITTSSTSHHSRPSKGRCVLAVQSADVWYELRNRGSRSEHSISRGLVK